MLALTPFRPDLGSVPLHMICRFDVREAYDRWRAGEPIPDELAAGMRRLSTLPRKQLQPGSER